MRLLLFLHSRGYGNSSVPIGSQLIFSTSPSRISSKPMIVSCQLICLSNKSGPLKSAKQKPATQPAFSESAAYFGRDRAMDPRLAIPVYIPDYYDSDRFRRYQIFSNFSAVIALLIYVAQFREERDYDKLWDIDPRLLDLDIQMQTIQNQMTALKKIGKTTATQEDNLKQLKSTETSVIAEIEKRNKIKELNDRKYQQYLETKKTDKEKRRAEGRWWPAWPF